MKTTYGNDAQGDHFILWYEHRPGIQYPPLAYVTGTKPYPYMKHRETPTSKSISLHFPNWEPALPPIP